MLPKFPHFLWLPFSFFFFFCCFAFSLVLRFLLLPLSVIYNFTFFFSIFHLFCFLSYSIFYVISRFFQFSFVRIVFVHPIFSYLPFSIASISGCSSAWKYLHLFAFLFFTRCVMHVLFAMFPICGTCSNETGWDTVWEWGWEWIEDGQTARDRQTDI